MSRTQQSLFKEKNYYGTSATHTGGKGEVFHDWYPYLEGFSSSFVSSVFEKYLSNAKKILDPFSGIGTTPIYLSINGIKSYYCEVNPVLQNLVISKSQVLNLDRIDKIKLVNKIEKIKKNLKNLNLENKDLELDKNYKFLFNKSIFFESSNYLLTLKLKSFSRKINDKLLKSLFDIAVYSSLLSASLLKRAGDVRFKTKKDLKNKKIPSILKLVIEKLDLIQRDLERINKPKVTPKLICINSKDLINIKSEKLDGVITSPPYLNGTNYFRNTKLELWYMEEINEKISLRDFRNETITAGINDVSSKTNKEVISEVKILYKKLKKNSYDRRIPQMVSDYFFDMKKVAQGLKKQVKKNGILCIDIGDSIYNKIHVQTDELLIKIFSNLNLKLLDNIILRDRLSHSKVKLTQRLLVFKNHG
jgi:hypothetical protein